MGFIYFYRVNLLFYVYIYVCTMLYLCFANNLGMTPILKYELLLGCHCDFVAWSYHSGTEFWFSFFPNTTWQVVIVTLGFLATVE